MDNSSLWEEAIDVHRPERSFPDLPAAAQLQLVAAPDAADPDQPGVWAAVLPLLASFSAVAYAVVVHNVLYLAMATLAVGASVGGTILARRAAGRRERNRRERRRAAYLGHLESARMRASEAAAIQRAALEGVYPPNRDLLRIARAGGALWERRPTDADFGCVRLGLGDVPALVTVAAPQGVNPTSEPDQDLADQAEVTARAASTLQGAAVLLPLASLSSVAVVGDRILTQPMVAAWVADLATFHPPGDVCVMGWVAPESAATWEWTKWLPHRTAAPSVDRGGHQVFTIDHADFAARLGELVTARSERRDRTRDRGQPDGFVVAPGQPWVAVVVDGYEPGSQIAATPGLDQALTQGIRLGITVVALCPDDESVPAACSARVDLDADRTCTYRLSGPGATASAGVLPERVDVAAADELARWLAPARLARGQGGSLAAGPVRLIDLLDEVPLAPPDALALGLTVQLPTVATAGLLATPIGRDDHGRPVLLDINEAAAGGQGPHGILVGATGSGKSELLRSFVAGLVARHSPEVLTILLMDFKGGAAFAELAGLPHTAGLITNLADDVAMIDRAQAALGGELERRQRVLCTSGHASIRTYHQEAAQVAGSEPLPYLVVVVDEFAELLSVRPDFLDTFVQIGRLGRSLGVHLLLASQRLDEGRLRGLESHLRYRIGLQTFTAGESIAVLGSAAAHDLPAVPGLGYFKVDTVLTRFRAAITSLPARADLPSDHLCKQIPFAWPFELAPSQPTQRPTQGPTQGTTGYETPHPPAARTDLAVLVAELTQRYPVRARQVWTPPLPHTLPLASTTRADDVTAPPLRAEVGLVDEPARQRRVPFVIDLEGAGHVAVAGGAGSGRSTFLRTLVRSLAAELDPSELHVYGIDLGGGGLREMTILPHVGAVAARHEPEAVQQVLAEVSHLAHERANLLRTGGPAVIAGFPHVVLLVDNLGQLRVEHQEAEAQLVELAATGPALRIHLALAVGRWLDVRPALLDAISTRFELRLGDPADSEVGRALASSVPARPGRGLTRDGRHLQLAQADVDHPVRVHPLGRVAPMIAPLPLHVYEPLRTEPGTEPQTGFAVGVEEHQQRPLQLDLLAPGHHLLVFGDAGSGRTTLLTRLVTWLSHRHSPDQVRIHLVDPCHTLARLAGLPSVASYAYEPSGAAEVVRLLEEELTGRRPPPGLSVQQLVARAWWDGPQHVLVVDDYERLVGRDGSPLTPLADPLSRAAELGWHVILSRRVTGSTRTAFEPFGQRLREVSPTALLLSGDPSEPAPVGDTKTSALPPGRGRLIRAGMPAVQVQTYLPGPGPAIGAVPEAGLQAGPEAGGQ